MPVPSMKFMRRTTSSQYMNVTHGQTEIIPILIYSMGVPME